MGVHGPLNILEVGSGAMDIYLVCRFSSRLAIEKSYTPSHPFQYGYFIKYKEYIVSYTVYQVFFRGNLIFAFSATIFNLPKIKHVEIMFVSVCHKKSLHIILNRKKITSAK